MIRLRVLGPVALHDAGGNQVRAVLAQPKRLALLAYLASSESGTFRRRDTLLGLFWPDLDEQHARAALNQAIRFLRKTLGESRPVIISRGEDEVGIDGTACWCDAADFRDRLTAGDFASALPLYGGDLLEGFFIEEADAFEEWLERERARLRAAAARAARALAEQREREQQFTTAVSCARRAVELSDSDERHVRELLELLDRLGDRAGAMHAYDRFAQRLANEFGAEPSAETTAVIKRIRARSEPYASDGDAGVTPWRIVRELGRGGMGTVYLAQDEKHDRYVAVKKMDRERALSIGPDQFLREIRIMGQLAHPHILPLIDSGAADGTLYLVMPYIAGESLRDRLRREGRLPIDDALRITREVAEALDYAHRQGIVHCDVKPANILLQDDQALVADFGIARALRASGDGDGGGTPSYMSPEQAHGEAAVDARSDIYSLGCVLHEMLIGEPSAAGAMPPEVPTHVAGAIRRARAQRPDERFESMAAFARAIDPTLSAQRGTSGDQQIQTVRRTFVQVLMGYLIAFPAAVILASMATTSLGLPDWVVPATVLMMALGLPLVLMTGLALTARASGEVITNEAHSGALARLTKRIAPHMSWRRTAVGGAGAMSGLALCVAAFMALRASGFGPFASVFSTGALRPQEKLLVTDFQLTGADSTLGPAVGVATRAALMRSSSITVLSSEALADALVRMRRAPTSVVDLGVGREIAAREGIRAIVAGHVIRTGQRFDIAMRLISTTSGDELVVLHGAATGVDQIVPAVDDLARQLRARLGESLKSVRATPPLPRETSASIEALRLYDQSLREPDNQKSLILVSDAIRADSEFAMAWRRKWIMMGNLGLNGPMRDSALAKAARLGQKLPEAQRLLVLAAYNNAHTVFLDADRSKAIAIYEQLAEQGNEAARINLPELLLTRREFARAESLQIANVRRAPDILFVREGLIHAQVELGKLDAAEAMIDSTLRRVPTNWPAQWWKLRMLYFHGQFDVFERALDSLRVAPDATRRRVASGARMNMALLRGRLKEWERLRAEVQSLTQAAGSSSSNADAVDQAYNDLLLRLDSAGAVTRVRAALRDFTPRRAQQTYRIGRLFARAGRPDLARALLARYNAASDTGWRRKEEFFAHRLLGEIAIAEGRGGDAIAEVRRGDVMTDGPAQGCHICLYRDLGYAFDRAGQTDSAIVMFERFSDMPSAFSLSMHPGELHIVLRRLGELYESRSARAIDNQAARADHELALHYYVRFVDLWANADPELQPQVADVRRRIARLRAKG